MKILHVISCLVKADGHSQFCMALAEHMAAQGLVQRIFTLPSQTGEALPDPQGLVCYASGRPIHVLNVAVHPGLEKQLAAAIRDFQPDVIHLHGGWHPVLLFGARAARRAGVPRVLSLHGSLRPAVVEGDGRLKKRLAWWLYQRRLVEMADVIHVSSEAEGTDVARLGFDKPVAIVPNGVDVEALSRKDAKAQRGGEREDGGRRTEDGEIVGSRQPATGNGLLAGTVGSNPTNERMNERNQALPRGAMRTRTVLYLGRLHPLKGLDLLISAWQRVAAERPGWRLLIAGPDENGYGSKIQERVKESGLAACVSFCGPLYGEARSSAMSSADLFVLPTRTENFGVVVAESLACGVPVITTKGAPWSELNGHSDSSSVHYCESSLVETNAADAKAPKGSMSVSCTHALMHSRTHELAASGRCGWWVDIGVEPLAEALREATGLSDAELLCMGENGRKLVMQKYQWKNVASEMAKVYEKCARVRMP